MRFYRKKDGEGRQGGGIRRSGPSKTETSGRKAKGEKRARESTSDNGRYLEPGEGGGPPVLQGRSYVVGFNYPAVMTINYARPTKEERNDCGAVPGYANVYWSPPLLKIHFLEPLLKFYSALSWKTQLKKIRIKVTAILKIS